MYKECNFGANRTYKEAFDAFLPALKDFYENPLKYAVEPFNIFGNLYYVGDQKVCMHLIDTGEGLILFDSGYGHNFNMLIDSIKKLGFSPEDIKYVIHSHGHFDHFGSSDKLRELYGAKSFMSRVDTELLREMPERALMHLSPVKDAKICWPDEVLEDGEVLTLGNTSIRCVLAPGHTFGTMAFFFDVTDGEKTYKVGYWGGVGFLTVYREYCRDYKMPETKCEMMKQSIKRLENEKVDIMIGNHPNQNCTLEKRQYMIENPGTNPFINPKSWSIFLEKLEQRRADFESLGY